MYFKIGFLSFCILLASCFSRVHAATDFLNGNNDLKDAGMGTGFMAEPESVRDTAVVLSEVAVVAHIKQKSDLRLEPLSSSVLKMGNIEREQVISLNDLSYYTPNLYIPDYGSRMTSSIYVRGLGSRMDNPAVGLYVDNIPYLNKNGFDTDLWDIMRMEVLRGPQSTLYGRNTIGGIINIHTLSPMIYQGTRLSVGYGNGNTYNVKGSTYWKPTDKFAFSVGANYYSTDGFFNNEYDGADCDWMNGGSGRFRLIFKPTDRFTIDNTFMIGKVEQGGYAYALYDPAGKVLNPVNYNDESGYVRTTISNGLSLNYQAPGFIFSSVTSWQFLDDRMTLDQDFTPNSMFTLQQAQKENTITQDFVFKRNGEQKKWQWLTGLTLFYKNMKMDAPVKFKKDGIDGLILNNINGMFQGMPAPMNTAKLSFVKDDFDLLSNFDMPVLGAALYHQSQLSVGKFTFTAGLRFDYECAKIDYKSNSTVDYLYSMKIQMSPVMPPREIKVESSVNTLLQDKLKEHYFEFLPKFAAQYSLEENGNLYASVSRGFKAGGYNTQMFSDILQNQVKSDLMADLMSKAGGSLGGAMGGGSSAGGPMGGSGSAAGASYTVQDIITYKPEYSWNYELGAHLNFFGGKLIADAAVFYIDCTDQQLTVFPSGTTTGRMMTNAGRTRSYGAEIALNGKVASGLDLALSYGYTNAKFVKYNDGHNNYKGNYVPYVPQNTLNATAAYTFYRVGNFLDKLSFRAGYNGIGKIYWNEENSISQDFYSLVNASIYAQKGIFSLELWSKNLTSTDYNAFYFVSVGNAFFSAGKPAQYGVTLSVEF